MLSQNLNEVRMIVEYAFIAVPTLFFIVQAYKIYSAAKGA